MAVVRSLKAQWERLNGEVQRLTEAIAHGAGSPKALVDAIREREAELEQLASRIAEAECNIQPLLMPRAPAVEEYLVGSASLFQDDFARDRALMERVLDSILVYANGAIVVHFKQATLFKPVNSFRVQHLEAEAPALPEARADHTSSLALVQEGLRRWKPDQDPNGLEYVAGEHQGGSPWVMALSKGARFVDQPSVRNGVGVPNGTFTVMNIAEVPEIARVRVEISLVA
jgi:hypothetical protein